MSQSVAAVVVTFCRREGLGATVAALRAQTHAPNSIVVVDNRGDVTLEDFADASGIVLLTPGDNTGAAGGFALGMQTAVDAGHDWVYLINDDDRPRPRALELLLVLASAGASRSLTPPANLIEVLA